MGIDYSNKMMEEIRAENKILKTAVEETPQSGHGMILKQ
jgi:hypothetical protein